MAKVKIKYASRATIKRLSRADVEQRVEFACIELPLIDPAYPCWWHDEYDAMLDEPLTAEDFMEHHKTRQDEWIEEHKDGQEHPQARETLFRLGLRSALERAGLDALNEIILARLTDKLHVPAGCHRWSHWQRRIATRLEREDAVFNVLEGDDRCEK